MQEILGQARKPKPKSPNNVPHSNGCKGAFFSHRRTWAQKSIKLPEISNAWQINQTAIRQEQVSTWLSGMVSSLQIQGSKPNVQHFTAVTPGASSWGYWLHLLY